MRVRRWLPLASAGHLTALSAGAVTNVLYARVLGAEDLGRIAVLYALANAIVLVGDAGLQLFVTRAVQSGTLDRASAATVLVLVVPGLSLAVWLLFCMSTMVAATQWESLAITLEFAGLLCELAVAIALFQGSLTLLQAVGSFNRRSVLVAANGWGTTGATAVALAISDSVPAAIHATAAGYALVAACGIVPVAATTGLRAVSRSRIWEFGRQARPLLLNSAITFAGGSADVLLAALLLPLSAVGQYRVFKAVASVVLAPTAGFLGPLFAQLSSLSDIERSELYSRVRRLSLGVHTASLIALAPLLSWGMTVTFGPSFSLEIAALVGLVVAFGLAFQHSLLGYVCTAAGSFTRPLVINITVFGTGALAAVSLSPLFALDGFVVANVSAHAAGLVAAGVMTAFAARRSFLNLVLWPWGTLLAAGGVTIWLQGLPTVPAAIIAGLLASLCAFAALAPASTYSSLSLFRHRPDAARAR